MNNWSQRLRTRDLHRPWPGRKNSLLQAHMLSSAFWELQWAARSVQTHAKPVSSQWLTSENCIPNPLQSLSFLECNECIPFLLSLFLFSSPFFLFLFLPASFSTPIFIWKADKDGEGKRDWPSPWFTPQVPATPGLGWKAFPMYFLLMLVPELINPTTGSSKTNCFHNDSKFSLQKHFQTKFWKAARAWKEWRDYRE